MIDLKGPYAVCEDENRKMINIEKKQNCRGGEKRGLFLSFKAITLKLTIMKRRIEKKNKKINGFIMGVSFELEVYGTEF